MFHLNCNYKGPKFDHRLTARWATQSLAWPFQVANQYGISALQGKKVGRVQANSIENDGLHKLNTT